MELKNYMEEVVLQKIDSVIARYPYCCKCEQCRLDIAALALNNLPPRYVSTHKGDIFVRIQEMEGKNDVDVIQAIAKAIEIVGKNPRHEQ